MDYYFEQALGPLSSIGKEFSAFSLFPNSYNIDNHWQLSVGLTAGSTVAKVTLYNYLSKSSTLIPQLSAKGLHAFGEYAALPLTAAATYQNAAIADRCTCQEISNPGAWAAARQARIDRETWINQNKPVYPMTPAAPLGF